jgi:hypothetical protein
VDELRKQKFWARLAVGTLAVAVLCLVSAIVFGLIIQTTAPRESMPSQPDLIHVHILGTLVYVPPIYKTIEDSLLIAFGVFSAVAILLVRRVFANGEPSLPRELDKQRIEKSLEASNRGLGCSHWICDLACHRRDNRLAADLRKDRNARDLSSHSGDRGHIGNRPTADGTAA